jgi:hypothetical protein
MRLFRREKGPNQGSPAGSAEDGHGADRECHRKEHHCRKEKGKLQYEVETTINGKARDFIVSATGELLEVEEAISIDSVPAAARAAILTKVGTGQLSKVETLTKGGKTTYEAAFKNKAGKTGSLAVTAEGQEAK